MEKIAHDNLDQFWSYHEAGEFDAGISIMRGLGFRKSVIDFVLSPDSYYVPNVRGNQLVRPKSVDKDKIPVVAMTEGLSYTSDAPSLHYLQKIALMMSGFSDESIDEIDANFAEHGGLMKPSGGPSGTGSVHRAVQSAKNGALIESSPTLILNAAQSHQETGESFEGVMLHELVHVTQTLSDPFWKNGNLRSELEAYAVQATLLNSFDVPYTLSTAMAGEVDIYRRKYLGQDNFEPTEEFLRDFARNPLLGKVTASMVTI